MMCKITKTFLCQQKRAVIAQKRHNYLQLKIFIKILICNNLTKFNQKVHPKICIHKFAIVILWMKGLGVGQSGIGDIINTENIPSFVIKRTSFATHIILTYRA